MAGWPGKRGLRRLVVTSPPRAQRRPSGVDMEIARNLWRRKLRTTLTVTGIVMGIFALTTMGAMAEHFNVLLNGGITYVGSTVQVGDAQGAPACVTDMTEFRTVAGRSTTASLPWPRASKPTQSTAHSTSGIPTICSICSASMASFRRSTTSQPKLFACANRSGIMSPTITHAAPSNWQQAAQASPTGPAPATYTMEPGPTPAETAP